MTNINTFSISCPFNTNIGTLSVTDFGRYLGITAAEAKTVLTDLFNSKVIATTAKTATSPYFVRSAALYLSNAWFKAQQEADEVAASEVEADELEGENIEATDEELAADEEAYGSDAELAEDDLADRQDEDRELEAEELASLADLPDDAPAIEAELEAAAKDTDLASIAFKAGDFWAHILMLDGKEVADRKAFRRMVRNHLTKQDLPWTIQDSNYLVKDSSYLYTISLDGGDIIVHSLALESI